MKKKTNSKYLPNFKLPGNIVATKDFRPIKDQQVLIIALPSEDLEIALRKIISYLSPDTILLIATKGLDSEPIGLFSDKIKSMMPNNFAFISGPNFALEFARGALTSFTIAAEDLNLAKNLQLSLKTENFIGTATDDIITIQVSGAVKNIIAIYFGFNAAKGMAENTKAYMMTQGLDEILQISKALGGSGSAAFTNGVIGDLLLTCYSVNSRNTKFGYKLAQAKNKKDFLLTYKELVEGRFAALIMSKIMEKYNLELPIISAVIKELGI